MILGGLGAHLQSGQITPQMLPPPQPCTVLRSMPGHSKKRLSHLEATKANSWSGFALLSDGGQAGAAIPQPSSQGICTPCPLSDPPLRCIIRSIAVDTSTMYLSSKVKETPISFADIDECGLSLHNCSRGMTCINTGGGFQCVNPECPKPSGNVSYVKTSPL